MNLKRVKFYSTSDLAGGYNLHIVDEILQKFTSGDKIYDLNDVIELFNIKHYIDSGLKLKSWTSEKVAKYKAIVKEFIQIIGTYLNCISDSNIVEEYLKVDIKYRDDFWELFNLFKVFKKISPEIFNNLLNLNEVSIYHVLKHQQIVKQYGSKIRGYLIQDIKTTKLILDKYEMKYTGKTNTIYLPTELTNDDIENIISKYIDSPQPHINFLEVIQYFKNSKELTISDRIKLKAKKRIMEEKDKLFKEGTGIQMGTGVSFSETQEEYRVFEANDQEWRFTYSCKWIQENIDYNTLLNNFIYLFELVDKQMRITFVHKMNEMGVLEEHLFVRSKHAYPCGTVFQQKNILAFLQITAYYRELKRNNIRLEEIFEWFFKVYLKDEFGISGFTIKMPSEDTTYLEKARSVFPELESVLKQYKFYVEDGDIDIELLEISSGVLDYDKLPSILNKKYVYGKGKEFDIIKYYLSSDQCMLSYIERIENRYDCFYQLLNNESIYKADYNEINSNEIDWLVENKIIEVDEYDKIQWKNKIVSMILYDLCMNDVISYWHYPADCRKYFNELQDKGIIEFTNTLFTRPEQDYISFLLNKSKFNNGYDIRNKCEHGTQANSETEENTHENYYMYALLVFVICIIKINDELCVKDELRNIETDDASS